MNQNIIRKLLNQDKSLLSKGIIKEIDNNYFLNTRYKIGHIIIKKDTAQLNLDNMQKIFIDLEKLNGAYDNDLVLVQIIFNPRGKTKAKVTHIIERNSTKILCYVKGGIFFTVKESIEIGLNKKIKSKNDGDIVIIENGNVGEMIGNISDPKVDEKISLYLYQEQYRLEDTNLDISKLLPKEKVSNRIDLSHLPFCTIDPVTAKDHDDAIYFDEKNSILYVAIADVSSYVIENSMLDIEARKRAFSIYLPNKVLPMLPFELSNDLCSLKPDVQRFAFVCKMQIDTKINMVIKSDFFEATIVSHNKYSYEQIDEQIENNELTPSLDMLYKLTQKLRKLRLQNGFDFRTEELRLKLDEEMLLENIVVETSSASHQLIEECMLLTNCEAAKKLKGTGIFRVHDEPSASAIEKLIDDVKALGLKVKMKSDIHKTIQSIQEKAKAKNLESEIDKLIISSQQQARYSSVLHEHFGLGFKNYSHFTSPIRRYADLVLHRMLKTKNITKDIDNICLDISYKEREIAYLVWDLEARIYARWAKNNVEQKFNAMIVDDQNGIAQLQDGARGARVICENYAGQKLFSDIVIKLKSSDIISKEIMTIIEE